MRSNGPNHVHSISILNSRCSLGKRKCIHTNLLEKPPPLNLHPSWHSCRTATIRHHVGKPPLRVIYAVAQAAFDNSFQNSTFLRFTGNSGIIGGELPRVLRSLPSLDHGSLILHPLKILPGRRLTHTAKSPPPPYRSPAGPYNIHC
jgi:hypothetical protein